MRIAIALLTLASFGSVFAVAQTPAAGTTDSTKSAKKSKKQHHNKKKSGDAATAPASK
jgi:hypothetical protein